MEEYSRYVSNLLNGDLPAWYTQLTSAVNLVALLKGPVQSDGVRPIAIQSFDMQVGSKAVMERHRETIKSILEPYHMGVGTRDAAGLMTHSARIILERNPSWAIAKMDVKQMFPSCSAGQIIRRVAQEQSLRDIAVVLWTMYSTPGLCTLAGSFHRDVIGQGLFMGNALSAAAASLYTLDVIKDAQVHLRNAANSDQCIVRTVIDDSLLVGPPEAIAATVSSIIIPRLTNLGLDVHPDKSHFYSQDMNVAPLDHIGFRRDTIRDPDDTEHPGIIILECHLAHQVTSVRSSMTSQRSTNVQLTTYSSWRIFVTLLRLLCYNKLSIGCRHTGYGTACRMTRVPWHTVWTWLWLLDTNKSLVFLLDPTMAAPRPCDGGFSRM